MPFRALAIDLDGQVVSAPITQPTQSSFTSFDGRVSISGGFTEDFAKTLAADLNFGALPVKLDRLTVQLKTSQPTPSLIEQVGRAFILSKKAATGLTTADFNAGKGMIGTGPYKFVEYKPAQYLKLVRNASNGKSLMFAFEGGYHGHHDEVMISMKPTLEQAGPAHAPHSVPATAGITRAVLSDTIVVPYNDPEALEAVLRNGDVAAFIVEPVMENIGICLPQPGYLRAVREITQRYGTMLIFDEVKTGITAGWAGASGTLGVQPDIVCLAKSIGGGLPLGAFGGTLECMDQISSGRVLHLGTYNGNPLCMAAAKAVLRDVCTPEATAETIRRSTAFADGCDAVIERYGLDAHTVRFGAKGCVTWAAEPIRNYRGYKSTDFDLAYAQWIHHINHGLLLPPGLDDQWLVSVLHTDADIARGVEVFEDFVELLCA